MAGYFQSFWTSSMPKRLIRYTLSKLDYFETDALDLDKIDIAWGQAGHLKWQDVGIKIQKLEKLLQLPPSIEILKAKVLVLHVTVPAAIHSSAIQVEADGVEIELRIVSPEEQRKAAQKGTGRRKTSRDHSAPVEDDTVPHAIDLAQSFLETQPRREKEELQAALNAEIPDLAASVSSSEDGSDEDYGFGTGQPLSLPTFLANFLQGMVDRLQFAIKGVVCHLDVDMPVDANSSTNEKVTFQLAIDEINAEGVTTTTTLNDDVDSASTPIHKEGKRYVELNRIRASIISEADVFSALSRTSSKSPSTGTSSPVVGNHMPSSQETSSVHATISPLGEDLTSSTDLGYGPIRPSVDSEDAFDIPYDLDTPSDDPEDDEARSAPSTPRAPPSRDPTQSFPWTGSSIRSAHSTIASRKDPWVDPTEPFARSEPAPGGVGLWGIASNESINENDDANSDLSSNQSNELSPSASQSLAQSRLFSHEDAESMYMSAFSHASTSHGRPTMPGAWGEVSSTAGSSNPKDNLRLETSSIAHDTHNHTLSAEAEDPAQKRGVVDNLHEVSHSPKNSSHDVLGADGFKDTSLPRSRKASLNDDAAEGVATPKGPTRLAKEVVSLSSLSLWFPSKLLSDPVPESESRGDETRRQRPRYHSVIGNTPGSFSVHQSMTQSTIFGQESSTSTAGAHNTPNSPDGSIEVVLAPLEVKFDLPTAFLLAAVTTRILSALGEPDHRATSKTATSPSLPSIKVIAERISIIFLDSLSAIAGTPEQILSARPPTFDVDALLTTTLQDIVINVSPSQPSAITTSIDVGKFKFGYANDNIICFDQAIQMRSSVRDTFPSAGSDISMTIVQSSDSKRCEINTLPLVAKLDLPRLDETFTWFGGLSGFLSLNSSMSTNNSPAVQSHARTSQKPRSVRFDAPIRPEDVSASSENKIDIRLGGLRLDLVGKDCSVSLDTSAVKLVSRDEGLGIGISKMQLAGPYIRRSTADPPVYAVIRGTRVEFLNSPKDHDLERLLELISPSKFKFDKNDDDIMIDTLLRQRRKGSVLRVGIDDIDMNVTRIQQLQVLQTLGEDVGRLSTMAKYLPEDDRPGLLTLALVRNTDITVNAGGKIGVLQASFKNFEVGHITLPSLLALGLGGIALQRNQREQLVSSIPPSGGVDDSPVVTMRMVGDEMEPIIKLRMRYLDFEYRVPTIMDILGLGEDATPQEFEASLAASVANLGEHAHATITGRPKSSSMASEQNKAKPTKVDVVIHDCLLGLNPLGLTSKMFLVLTNARLEISLSKGEDADVLGHINKASVLLIDDTSAQPKGSYTARRRSSSTVAQVVELHQQGFVEICFLSSAKVVVRVAANDEDGTRKVDIEVRDDLLVLETCADSTQTLIQLVNALAPPTPPKREIKYRTNIVPMQDMLASISADAFGKAEGGYNFDDDFLAHDLGDDDDDNSLGLGGSEYSSHLAVDSQFYGDSASQQGPVDNTDSIMSHHTTVVDTHDGVLLTNFSSQPEDLDDGSDLDIHEDYFNSRSITEGTAHRWNSTNKEYYKSYSKKQESPLSVHVRDVHFIWNLFDGYDWNRTRDIITKAVSDIETTAVERQARQERVRAGTDMEIVDEETVIDDFLFNSIYIGIPTNRDPRELAQAINQELNDNATETESIATTAMTVTAARPGGGHRSKKLLRLSRSKRHKITFELKGINIDLITFPPGSGETQSSIDIRIKDLVVFDHVPTSTWKKFATYDQDAGEREMDASMVHLEVLIVQPHPELSASEIVLKAEVLPLRLHVDQDALDFITRFFEFKDDSAPTHASPSDIPFIQRAEVRSIPVTLDFKPKRVDYAGLRSGHTTEFMNFVVLDQSRLVLRRCIVYGARGFDRLGETLNNIWMPDVKRNQLPGVLAGLAPVRSLVTVGSGFKELIEIPIREYKKDGRIVRSIGKGAAAFAKTTGTELIKLGAKLAVGTQYALQGAEGLLTNPPEPVSAGWQDDDTESEETGQISLYANQPTGVMQGLKGAYSSLARDLNLARDAIIAVPGEVMESENAQGVARAVLRRAPTIIFRPLIGSSKAIGQTLMGATNALDPENRRRVEEKYKRH